MSQPPIAASPAAAPDVPLDWGTDLQMRGLKFVDIGLATTLYFALAMVAISVLNWVQGPFDEKLQDHKSTLYIMGEIILRVWFMGMLAYVARNLVPLIPMPWDGFNGYKRNLVKELGSGAVFASFSVSFDTTLQGQISYLKKRLNGQAPQVQEGDGLMMMSPTEAPAR